MVNSELELKLEGCFAGSFIATAYLSAKADDPLRKKEKYNIAYTVLYEGEDVGPGDFTQLFRDIHSSVERCAKATSQWHRVVLAEKGRKFKGKREAAAYLNAVWAFQKFYDFVEGYLGREVDEDMQSEFDELRKNIDIHLDVLETIPVFRKYELLLSLDLPAIYAPFAVVAERDV